MFDDSVIDYMLRMQGRNISIKMAEEVALIGEGTVKTKEISKALKMRLNRYIDDMTPRTCREAPFVRMDFLTFNDVTDGITKNYILLHRFPSRETIDLRGYREYDFWQGDQGHPNNVGLWNNDLDQLGQWYTLGAIGRANMQDRLSDWQYNRWTKVLHLDPADGVWKLLGRTTQRFRNLLEMVAMEVPDWRLTAFRSMLVDRAVAIDLELLGRHMLRADEYCHEVYEHGVGFDVMSWNHEPSFIWKEFRDEHGNPPFQKLIFAEYIYKFTRDAAGKSSWLTHPKSQYVVKDGTFAYDGEWYTYAIPSVEVRSKDDDILKDFQNFLRKKLVV